ncbi:amidohydrolase/deacetylase family metallohydrolase [Chryseolinea lacunae]|uniref:Amidohydrolase/deacetylase family metallohydrolase n=1 Tax=Chryseolinea lacunae TaxID=2801331 RepID=A0ABS1KXP3_9BACT|nr:amidohydrolase/deacetylase family metallohydrolase [Chryseolinea lacunae]MBL0743997.1 amidohydrolase/deacetylase family metallohydrolase [Chryseolinea lacunae]
MQTSRILHILVLCLCAGLLHAQDYTILIKGGHVIDPKNNIDDVMDVAVKDDKVALVAKNIDAKKAALVIDAKGLYVTPGVIDIHSHNFFGTQEDHYLGDGFEALPPDGFTFRSGVTTVVDAGGAGWKTFNTFKAQTMAHSKTRVLSFLNIVGEGMRGGAYEQNLSDMDPKLTAMVVKQHREIVGIKVAHYTGAEWDPVDRAVEAGKIANVPVIVDFGGHLPPLSIQDLFTKHLRPGDIFTHTFARVAGRQPIVDAQGKMLPFVSEAQKNGIVFDVGHGGGSFLFSQAIPALKSGFIPNTISTDAHTGSMNAGMKDQLNVMSKFLNIGMTLSQVIGASTWNPAQVIRRDDLGHLSVGAGADIAVFNVLNGKFGFIDSGGFKANGTQKMECELTLRDGKVVYDLNGISKTPWDAPEKK